MSAANESMSRDGVTGGQSNGWGVRGRVILVTGAASGLGFADSKMLVEQGARVVMTDVDEERGRGLAEDLDAVFLHKMLPMKGVGPRSWQRWKGVLADWMAW